MPQGNWGTGVNVGFILLFLIILGAEFIGAIIFFPADEVIVPADLIIDAFLVVMFLRGNNMLPGAKL